MKEKKSKWRPIDTVPLGVPVLIWDIELHRAKGAVIVDLGCLPLGLYSHWRPMVKGPVVSK